ncbi:large ribosomal subunit protein bL12m [Lissotriton helveticus]
MLPVCHWGRFCRRLRIIPIFLHRTERQSLAAPRTLTTTCAWRNDALATPPLDSAPKMYAPKIQQLVDDIAGLTLLEISELNELLKKTLKIQDVGMMPMGATLPGVGGQQAAEAAEEEDTPVKTEKTQFTVKLTEFSAADKVKLIKEVKNCMQGLNLVQAKKLVESLPQEIKANISKEEAEKMKAALEAAGGKVLLE